MKVLLHLEKTPFDAKSNENMLLGFFTIALCIPMYILQFSSLFASTVGSKCTIRKQRDMRIIFQGYILYENSSFLMGELKRSWQGWHSCIAERL